MWQLLRNFLPLIRANPSAIFLPITITVGFIGYNFENWLTVKDPGNRESVLEKRRERNLEEFDLKNSTNIPSFETENSLNKGTIFDKLKKE